MVYLILASKQEAIERSREAWEAVLGRRKNSEDVTEFMWGWDVGKDGTTALVIREKAELLTEGEGEVAISTLPADKGENWEKQTATMGVAEGR